MHVPGHTAPGGVRLLLATRNPGKLRELRRLLKGCPLPLVSLGSAGVPEDVEESGATIEENAILKAAGYGRLSGLPTLADDSALEVDALGGAPGVLSARFAGEGATDAQKVDLLLRKVDNIPEERRGARFRCAVAVAWPGIPVKLFTGQCAGTIAMAPRGGGGFGYDPVFIVPRYGKTMAELTPAQKDRVSHRGIAARKALKGLKQLAAEMGGLKQRNQRG